jgi:hypothetical protein
MNAEDAIRQLPKELRARLALLGINFLTHYMHQHTVTLGFPQDSRGLAGMITLHYWPHTRGLPNRGCWQWNKYQWPDLKTAIEEILILKESSYA